MRIAYGELTLRADAASRRNREVIAASSEAHALEITLSATSSLSTSSSAR